MKSKHAVESIARKAREYWKGAMVLHANMLSIRAMNGLLNCGVTTVDDLKALRDGTHDYRLTGIPNVGRKSIGEINAFMDAVFADEVVEPDLAAELLRCRAENARLRRIITKLYKAAT